MNLLKEILNKVINKKLASLSSWPETRIATTLQGKPLRIFLA